jgi:alkylation response protein AidB-like acyl-CoA dehydrogenase
MYPLKNYDAAEVLEQYLGDPLNTNNVLSFKRAVELDEAEEYPEEACSILERWNFHHYYVPVAYGGKLTSYEEMLALMRVVARRDLTVAIGHGKTYLGSVCVWIGGTAAQHHRLATLIKQQARVSLGLTERAHGSDLLASEVQAVQVANGYVLSGEKWLINNATRGQALTVFARTDAARGARGFSVLLVEKGHLAPSSYRHLPKVKTHGIRGADISGIQFQACFVPSTSLIGPPGSGLEIVLKSLQITRTMCASLSLGAADTALRSTVHFALTRRLYGGTVFAIPYTRHLLGHAFLDLLMCDCAAIAAARALHVVPAQMSLWSAVVKYIVPTTIERVIHDLSVVLGARYYVREAHWGGIFQKIVRDNALVSLFDGSSVVNLHAIALQLRHLAKRRAQGMSDSGAELAARLGDLFALDRPLPAFEPGHLSLFNHGCNDVLQGLGMSLARLETLPKTPDVDPELLQSIITLTRDILLALDTHANGLSQIPLTKGYQEPPEQFTLAKHYCVLHLAAVCLHMWLYNRQRLGDFFARGAWLALCLHKLLTTVQPWREPPAGVGIEPITAELIRLYNEERLFSIVPFQLAGAELAGERSDIV